MAYKPKMETSSSQPTSEGKRRFTQESRATSQHSSRGEKWTCGTGADWGPYLWSPQRYKKISSKFHQISIPPNVGVYWCSFPELYFGFVAVIGIKYGIIFSGTFLQLRRRLFLQVQAGPAAQGFSGDGFRGWRGGGTVINSRLPKYIL